MGDGAMVTFPNSDTAINAAIKIQEGVADLREKNIADVSCTVGITSGTVISFETSHGKDYVGTVVDTAARLQSAAKEHGILVSKTVFSSGLMNKITSTYGSAIKRKPEEYIAQVDKIKLKGINGEVEYCEILWSDKYFGIKETIKKAEDPKG
jgi:class 3 adenylate cyclase